MRGPAVLATLASWLIRHGLSNHMPLSTILGHSELVLASHLAKIFISPPSLSASYPTVANPRSPLDNSFLPAAIGFSAVMVGPRHLQFSYPVAYVNDYSFLSDIISNSSLQRNSEHSTFHSSLRAERLFCGPD